MLRRYINFYPRSRKGSDLPPSPRTQGNNISIHAPARGATVWQFHFSGTHRISIHAPARGATEYFQPDYSPHQLFLSTLPQGERQIQQAVDNYLEEFLSTLPQGERRNQSKPNSVNTLNFYPRSRKGSDCNAYMSIIYHHVFLSTLPQGERLQRRLNW